MCTNPKKLQIRNKDNEIEWIWAKCGKCDTCKREKYQEWAIKLINESKYHKKNCFITLTFDNRILKDKTSKAHMYGAHAGFVFNTSESNEYFKKFMKRLRKHYKNKSISFFHVAEYGEKKKRPHHHAIIFGVNFEEDRKEGPQSKSGKIQYVSETLNRLWACGACTIQDCLPNNIIYISQYSVKKYKNEKEEERYKAKMTFSNRKKMNVKWVRRNHKEIQKGYLEDRDGKKYRIPKSYLNNLKNEKENDEMNRSWRIYDEQLNERFSNITHSELVKKQKIKEKIRKLRAEKLNKSRDF